MSHRSLISCFQETFFPAAEFLVTSHRSVLFPGWCPIPFPEGCGHFHRLLNFHFHRSVHFYFSGVARFLSKLSFGCDLWRSVSIHSEEWMARFPSVMPVSNSFSEGPILGSVSSKPFVVAEVVPKNCYCYSSRRCTVVSTTATRLQPSLFHTSKWLCGRSLPKLRFFL